MGEYVRKIEMYNGEMEVRMIFDGLTRYTSECVTVQVKTTYRIIRPLKDSAFVRDLVKDFVIKNYGVPPLVAELFVNPDAVVRAGDLDV